jgi:hypothetical protein
VSSSAPVFAPAAPVAVQAQSAAPGTIYEKIILGGLMLAGATLVLTWAFGGSHN